MVARDRIELPSAPCKDAALPLDERAKKLGVLYQDRTDTKAVTTPCADHYTNSTIKFGAGRGDRTLNSTLARSCVTTSTIPAKFILKYTKIMHFNMKSVPTLTAYCLSNVGRRSSGLDIRMRSPPPLAYF